jgi:hypothetical protein
MISDKYTNFMPQCQVVVASGHNPFYIMFEDLKPDEKINFYGIDEGEKRKIEKCFNEITSLKLTS